MIFVSPTLNSPCIPYKMALNPAFALLSSCIIIIWLPYLHLLSSNYWGYQGQDPWWKLPVGLAGGRGRRPSEVEGCGTGEQMSRPVLLQKDINGIKNIPDNHP